MSAHGDIPALTGLRFVAAFMVVVAHIAAHLPAGRLSGLLLELAFSGMMLFFALSGFVIWLNYAQSIALRRPGALWEFAGARFARLYPMYLVAILLGQVLTALNDGPSRVQVLIPATLHFLMLLQTWSVSDNDHLLATALPYLQHLWSISTEVFFYTLFPLIAVSLIKARRPATIVFIGAVNILLAGFGYYMALSQSKQIMSAMVPHVSELDGWNWLVYFSPYLRIFQFIAGCIGCHLFLSLAGREPTKKELAVATMAACVAGGTIAAIICGVWFGSVVSNYFFVELAPLAALPYLMFYFSRYRSRIGQLLASRAAVAAGDASYSIYLIHPFVLIAASRLIDPQSDIGGQLGFFVLSAGSAVLISLATFRIIELPAKRWLRRHLSNGLLRRGTATSGNLLRRGTGARTG
jgi:peptidoglycan/LPS O-acetylase OafA/YrhL